MADATLAGVAPDSVKVGAVHTVMLAAPVALVLPVALAAPVVPVVPVVRGAPVVPVVPVVHLVPVRLVALWTSSIRATQVLTLGHPSRLQRPSCGTVRSP